MYHDYEAAMKFIIAIGSNYQSEQALALARLLLKENFSDIIFSDEMKTKAIGIDAPDFVNCIAKGSTKMSYDELNKLFKNIEEKCGNSRELRKENLVKMDIDILLYGKNKYHIDDWNRDYIKALTKEFI